MKKLSLFFLLMGGVTLASSAEVLSDVNVGGILYNIDTEAKTATVAYQLPYSGPADLDFTNGVTYNGEHYDITAIAGNAFFQCKTIKSLKLPTTLTTIGQGAFYETSLSSPLVLPEGLTTIESNAFCRTPISGELILPPTLSVLGANAFDGTNIESLELKCGPLKAKSSDRYPWNNQTNSSLFANNKNLKTVTFSGPAGTWTAIPAFMFSECTNLTSVTLPEFNKSLGAIGQSSFNNCSLTELTLPESVTQIDTNAFVGNQITNLVIPKNVTSIGASAFEYNPIEELVIKGTDKSLRIQDYAFRQKAPSALKSIVISRSTPPSLGKNNASTTTFDQVFGQQNANGVSQPVDEQTIYLVDAANENMDAYKEDKKWTTKTDDIQTGVGTVMTDQQTIYNVYDASGILRLSTPDRRAIDSLDPGLYIINGKKTIIRK